MWFLYIIKCKNNNLYTGVTDNLQRRFQEYKEGRGARYTRLFKPEKIIYIEKYFTKEEALKREKQIKGWRREKKENLIKFGTAKTPG